ncbi:IclR family transcriptional regulator [Sphingobium sp. SCG-1]|uniref:IclR family transcriptional regulator n=1 Tax=Sphingobium sp. SCG-1 TaxID=2072936 RepID=UPI0016713139|nr:IclR family transcriptional regulator [Sphingobium sp. SCG-1]
MARALELLDITVRDNGHSNVLELSERLNLPKATAHRLMKALNDAGYLANVGRGKHVGGPALRSLMAVLGPSDVLSSVARPILKKLSRKTGFTAHLGVLQGSMVTYLVKENHGADQLFTREGTQLEAYCSAIGKVLLANLPETDRGAYLGTGPFIALTPTTIIEPEVLCAHLKEVKQAGFALDDREISPNLVCVAVPIFGPDESVTAAISLARIDEFGASATNLKIVPLLRKASGEITSRMTALAHAF